MEHGKNIVAITEFDGTIGPLKEAITLCDGFGDLKKEDHVLLKPNIVWGGGLLKSADKFGFVTTKRLMEDIIILLKEHGCSKISIGEGTLVDKGLKSSTAAGYKWTKYTKLSKKYGVSLIDFNEDSYETVELGGAKTRIAESALSCDFMINVPVLKTHSQTMLSLGIKNLKGCLSVPSRRIFHTTALHKLIAELGNYIKPNLTIIDGIYSLANGPSSAGKAFRSNVIIAGKDMFSCDIVGGHVLGIDPSTVPHLQDYSKVANRPIDLNGITIKGKKIEDVQNPVDWRLDYSDFFTNSNISGSIIQEPGDNLCSGCASGYLPIILLFTTDNKDFELDNLEICVGPTVKASKDAKTVFLIGNCSIAANKDVQDAIKIEGCPPNTLKFFRLLYKHGKKGAFRKRLFKMMGTMMGVYKEDLLNRNYTYPEFNKNHWK